MCRLSQALFLDRDGVINQDTGYVHRVEDFHFINGIFPLCRTAQALGLQIHVVTNQAGIARGYYTEDDFSQLTRWMLERFAQEAAPLTAVHFCPFHAEQGIGLYRAASHRRKPEPGMILEAAAAFGLDLSRSALIGDKASDIEAARRAGVGLRIVMTSELDEVVACPAGTFTVESLAEAEVLIRFCYTEIRKVGKNCIGNV
jgi:D-glycero-D-manno-heptose 1,7-bisphosphate phosphatase